MINRIKSLAKEVTELYVKPIRRQIHKYPELSFHEHDTVKLIEDYLYSWNIEQYYVNHPGVIAVIRGKNPRKRTIALRADMDALPIQEKNKCDYSSVRQGVMHACGHDAHTAMLLGVAKVLNELKDEFEGTVRLIFQAGEEKLPGGAKLMIKDNVLYGVDAIIAQHVYPDLPCGEVGFYAGNYMAACDEINITISGKGGHAAKINERSNTTVAAAKILCAISELSSEFNKEERENPVIIAFGNFVADGTYNVIPDKVCLKGTMRTFDEKERKLIKKKIKTISAEIAASFGVEAIVKINKGYPVLKNDVDFTKSLRNNAMDFLGEERVKSLPQLMTAEDFAWYSHEVKACMYRLGTSNVKKGIVSKQHTPTFDIDEDALEIGVGTMAYLVVASSREL